MDIQQKTQEVEQELLALIIKHLRDNKIEVRTASKLARDFLAVLPMKNQQDLLEKLKSLGTNYAEARYIYQQELARDTRQKEVQAILQMHGAIRRGNIEHAISVAKSLQTST